MLIAVTKILHPGKMLDCRTILSFNTLLPPLHSSCFRMSRRMQGSASSLRRISNYDFFISDKSRKRKPCILRELTKKLAGMPPHTIPFSIGSPNVNTFPFQEMTVKLRDGTAFTIEGRDMQNGLQYLSTQGHGPLVEHLKKLQDLIHGPQDWSCTSVMPTCGSVEGMTDIFEMVLNPGDCVIAPIPLYIAAAESLRILDLESIELHQDKHGANPEVLQKALEDRVKNKKSLPKLMYINPTACNPTARNLTLERKKEFYRLACEYNFLIMEDDPYYFVHFSEENSPSFLSMDVEGRVLRLDSFSKVLSSGLRLGYLTGPPQLVRQVELQIQATTIHTSSLSQVLVTKLLDYWGLERFLTHVAEVKKFYRERRDQMIAACDRNLKDLCTWDVPEGGMFVWMQVPALQDTLSLALEHCIDRCLLIVPGHPFAGDKTPSNYNYIRLSFSMATPAQMEEGTKILADVIREVQSKQTIKK